MFECLIDYWKTIDLGKKDLIHEFDKDLDNNNDQRPDKYRLHLDLFPEPFNGNLKAPKIVFLFLNPGFNGADYGVKECKDFSEDVKKAFYQNYTKKDEYPFLWLNPKYNKYNNGSTRNNPGAYYWNKLFDQKTGKSFLKNIFGKCKESEKSKYLEERKWIAQNVCDIELFPYHSQKFHYSYADCESADIARSNVFLEIYKHPEVLFVFMRSVKLWTNGCKEWEDLLNKRDFKVNTNGNVIINPCPRNPSLNPDKELGKTIYDWLSKKYKLVD